MLFLPDTTLRRRILNGVAKGRKFVFLFGSGISRAARPGELGVPMADQFVQRIRKIFPNKTIRDYSHAFDVLIQEHGADDANRLVQSCVLEAYAERENLNHSYSSDALENYEQNFDAWLQPVALRALSALIYMHPPSFATTILTTNFDPLIEICLSAAQRCWFSMYLHGDGSLQYSRGSGVSVVHLHGHWTRSDTLHTTQQLKQPRPKLLGSLKAQLQQDTTLIVIGYGGWPDVATAALASIIDEDQPRYDIVWCFYSKSEEHIKKENRSVINMMKTANQRGRGHCVLGVDANEFMSKLLEDMRKEKPAQDVDTYFQLETEVLNNRFFRWEGGPWDDRGMPPDSVGEVIKPLTAFGVEVVAAAALAAIEIDLSNLELQPLNASHNPQRLGWIRPALGFAFRALRHKDKSEASKMREYSYQAHCEARLAEDGLSSLNSRERHLLRAVDYAFASAAAALSGSDERIDHGSYPADVLAAKAVHIMWRYRDDDAIFVLQNLKLRLGRQGFGVYTPSRNPYS